MGRSRYKIYEPTHPHFITCTVINWIPLFTRKESVEILLESFRYLQETDNLKLYDYVILENHIHIVAQSDNIGKSMAKFKRHTARALIKLLQKRPQGRQRVSALARRYTAKTHANRCDDDKQD